MAGREMIEVMASRATADAYSPMEDLHGDPGCVLMEEGTFWDIQVAQLEAFFFKATDTVQHVMPA